MKHRLAFTDVVRLLREASASLVEELRKSPGDANALETKRQLDRAIKCLEFCETHQVHPDSEVIRMPWPTTHFGGLQVVDVSEDDDPASWTAAMVNGRPVKLQAGDLAIRSSHAFNLPE